MPSDYVREYVDSSLDRKREASSALWADFKTLQSVALRGIETNEARADLAGPASY